MALLKYTQDEVTYAQCDGKLYGVKYRDCCGKNQKPFVRFSVAYGSKIDEFDNRTNLYMNCIAWGRWAELVNALSEQNKLTVLVCGEISVNEYNGEQREQLVCSWVQSAQEIETPKGKTTKADDKDWETAETEFSD